ncbi:hypothetical protein D3C72_1929550 [compost metagenome]
MLEQAGVRAAVHRCSGNQQLGRLDPLQRLFDARLHFLAGERLPQRARNGRQFHQLHIDMQPVTQLVQQLPYQQQRA